MLPTITFQGRIANDLEINEFGEKKRNDCVMNATLAVNKSVKKGDDWVDEPHFFTCTLWGHNARFIKEYANKGDGIVVHGNLEQKIWEDKEGNKKYDVIINVKHAELGVKKKSESKKEEKDPFE